MTINISQCVIRNFTSQWFLIAQGSGILSIILHNLDYQFNGLGIISVIIWLYTCFIFVLSLIIYALRSLRFPKRLRAALYSDTAEISALSSISITLTTIIDMICLVCVPAWGSTWGLVAYGLIWFNILIASIACIGIPYVLLQVEHPGVKNITPVVLLPFISALTATAGAGVICLNAQISPILQVPLIIVAFVLLGTALPLTLAYDALYLARLFDGYSMAPEMTYQTFILCGPLGQASFALQVLGTASRDSFGGYTKGVFLQADAGVIVGTCCTLCALVTWGYGLFFWVYAVCATMQGLWRQDGGLRSTRFVMSSWSVVFPWGVFTISAVQFGKPMGLDSEAWAILSTILAVVMFAIWLLLTLCTWRGIATGELLGVRGWKGKDGLKEGSPESKQEV
ncbi:hypothetical protein AA313_de0200360 [Arthrobotrys entomopaga]|nr:hypothetical protein AA313_de0200360 [Arthrobotrys entomopaga]